MEVLDAGDDLAAKTALLDAKIAEIQRLEDQLETNEADAEAIVASKDTEIQGLRAQLVDADATEATLSAEIQGLRAQLADADAKEAALSIKLSDALRASDDNEAQLSSATALIEVLKKPSNTGDTAQKDIMIRNTQAQFSAALNHIESMENVSVLTG